MLKTTVEVNNADIKTALKELAERLSGLGYCEFCACFNPLYPNYVLWEQYRNDAPQHLWDIIDLFLLGKSIEKQKIEVTMGGLIEPLSEAGLLYIYDNGKVSTTDLVLLPVFGFWLFFQKPQINPLLYFGEDSIALLLRQRPKLNGTCLDLCAGPGVQSIFSSLYSSKVTSVEINPFASALASINVLINGLEGKIELLCGDLYDPVKGRTFDRIVANPPLLPFPDEIPYPFVGHGGHDGLRITRRILEGIPTFLSEAGFAQIIGTCLSDGIIPMWVDELSDWAIQNKMDTILTITCHRPLHQGSRMFDGLVYTAAMANGLDYQYVADAYKKSLESQQATHICAYYLFVKPGKRGLCVQDLSRDENMNFWYITNMC